MRNLIQEQIKKYKDGDSTLTPKELADLAKAARDTAAFSAEVFEGKPDLSPPGEKPAEKVEDLPDFNQLEKPIEIQSEEKKDE